MNLSIQSWTYLALLSLLLSSQSALLLISSQTLISGNSVIAYANQSQLSIEIYSPSGTMLKQISAATDVIPNQRSFTLLSQRDGGFILLYILSSQSNVIFKQYDASGNLLASVPYFSGIMTSLTVSPTIDGGIATFVKGGSEYWYQILKRDGCASGNTQGYPENELGSSSILIDGRIVLSFSPQTKMRIYFSNLEHNSLSSAHNLISSSIVLSAPLDNGGFAIIGLDSSQNVKVSLFNSIISEYFTSVIGKTLVKNYGYYCISELCQNGFVACFLDISLDIICRGYNNQGSILYNYTEAVGTAPDYIVCTKTLNGGFILTYTLSNSIFNKVYNGSITCSSSNNSLSYSQCFSSTNCTTNGIPFCKNAWMSCGGGKYLYPNGSCLSSCNHHNSNTSTVPWTCNPCESYLYQNQSCLGTCTYPYVIHNASYCNFSCLSNEFLFQNGSCLSFCPLPYKNSSDSNGFFCNFPCNQNTFLYPNATCLNTCDPPFIMTQNYSGYMICEFMCPSNSSYNSRLSTCFTSCPSQGFLLQNIGGYSHCEAFCSDPNQFYLTLNNTCTTICLSQAFRVRNQSAVLFCDFVCTNPSHVYIPKTNQCIADCPSSLFRNSSYPICSECPQNCTSCIDPFTCLSCKIQFQLSAGICIPKITTNSSNSTTQIKQTFSLGTDNVVSSIKIPNIQLIAVSSDKNYIYVSSDSGTKIISVDVTSSSDPKIVGSLNTTNSQAIKLVGNKAFLADSLSGLAIIDLSNPLALSIISVLPITNARDVEIDETNNLAYLTDKNGKLYIVDISNIGAPNILKTFQIPPNTMEVNKMSLLGDKKTVVITSNTGLYITDVTNVANPLLVSKIENISPSSHALNALNSNYVLLTDSSGGIKIVDISNKLSPIIIDSIATSQIQNIVSVGKYVYVTSGSNLVIFDSSSLTSLKSMGSIPTNNLAQAVDVSLDNANGYLVDGTSNLRIVNFQSSPLFILYIKYDKFMLGETYSNTLLIYNQNLAGSYELFSDDYKFSKISLYTVSYSTDSSLKKSYTALPYWLSFDYETNVLIANPNLQGLIGEYNLYGAFSLSIPTNVFIGVGSISSEAQSIELIDRLARYIDENSYLTSKFNPNSKMILGSSYANDEIAIRKKLSEYYMPVIAKFKVASSLNIELNHGNASMDSFISLTSNSLYTSSISIIFNSSNIKFVIETSPALIKLNSQGNYIILTASIDDLNKALKNLRVDISNQTNYDGAIFINDGLNPTQEMNVSNLTNYFKRNQRPQIKINIQSQLSDASFVTGSQFSIFLDTQTFIDPDGDSLTYTLLSSNYDSNIPSWIDFKNFILSGIPPDQLEFETSLVIRASDGYKYVDGPFTLKVRPSLFFLIQYFASYAGPIIGILGLWVYESKIYNLFCKRRYRYSRSFVVKGGTHVGDCQIFPVALIALHLKEVKILIKKLRHHIAKEKFKPEISITELIDYFIDKNSLQINQALVIEYITKNIFSLKTKLSLRMLPLYFLDVGHNRQRIYDLLINQLYLYQLETKNESATRKIFNQYKDKWYQMIKIDRDNPLGPNGLPNFIIGDKLRQLPEIMCHIDSIGTEQAQEKRINVALLENAILSYAQLKHNLHYNMPGISISSVEKVLIKNPVLRLWKLFVSGSYPSDNQTSGSIGYGIDYCINNELITFQGDCFESIKNKTIIVSITNSSGRLVRQFSIKGYSDLKKSIFTMNNKSEISINKRHLETITNQKYVHTESKSVLNEEPSNIESLKDNHGSFLEEDFKGREKFKEFENDSIIKNDDSIHPIGDPGLPERLKFTRKMNR